MKTKRFTPPLILFLILISGVILLGQAEADDVSALLKKTDKALRQAQRDMYAGKTEKAIAALESIEQWIHHIEAVDLNNPKLNIIKSKFNKLVKDLERRTGKQLGGGTVTSMKKEEPQKTAQNTQIRHRKEANEHPGVPPVPKSKSVSSQKIPFAARRPLDIARRNLFSLQKDLAKLSDPAYGGDKDQLVSNLEKRTALIRQSLSEAKSAAAAKGVTSHPDFDTVEEELTQAEQQMKQAASTYETEKAAAAASAEAVQADVSALKSLLDKVQPVFEKAPGNVVYYSNPQQLEKVIAEIERFENEELSEAQSKMRTFAAKYGTTAEEIDQKADAAGYVRIYYKASYPYQQLKQGIDNVQKTRSLMAEDLVRRINRELDGISKGADFMVLDRYNKVRAWLNLARRFQADNPMVLDLQNTLEQKIAVGMKEFNARVDSRKWPAHAANAPGNADALASEALKWFRNSPDWGKRESKVRRPLAVVVTGPWSVQKRNLLGEPIMYGLPIKLAVLVDEDKELNVARVYELTMRTAERRGVKMAPPFTEITVGNSYFIRPEKVK